MKEVFSRLKGTGLLIESILNECLCLPTNFLKIYNNDRSWDFMAALHYFPATECENNGIIVSTLCSKMMLEAFELTNMVNGQFCYQCSRCSSGTKKN